MESAVAASFTSVLLLFKLQSPYTAEMIILDYRVSCVHRGGTNGRLSLCPPPPLQVTASDADGGSFGTISYSLGSGLNSAPPSQFSVHKETGEICTSLALDREHGQSSYDFTVNAVDGVRRGDVAALKHPPHFSFMSIGLNQS